MSVMESWVVPFLMVHHMDGRGTDHLARFAVITKSALTTVACKYRRRDVRKKDAAPSKGALYPVPMATGPEQAS